MGNHIAELREIGSIGVCKVCTEPIQLAARSVYGHGYWWHLGVGPNHYAAAAQIKEGELDET